MVLVQDMDRAVRFYKDHLGLSLNYEQEDWAIFDEGVGLMLSPDPLPSDTIAVNAVFISLNVADVQQAFNELTSKGVAFLVPPTDVGGAIIATLRDSEGNLLQILQHSE